MKNKLFLLSFLSIFLLQVASAQTSANGPHLGFRAGVNFAKWAISSEGVSVSFGSLTALQVRGVYQSPVGLNSSISLEAGYTGRGFDLSGIGGLFGGDDSNVRVDYVDFNGTYKYHLPSTSGFNVFFGGGLTLGYAFGGSVNDGGQREPIDFDESGIQRLDLVVEPVAGFSIGESTKFVLDARYGFGIINLISDDTDPDAGTANNRGILITAGIAVPIN